LHATPEMLSIFAERGTPLKVAGCCCAKPGAGA
jgi:hypothetical protein